MPSAIHRAIFASLGVNLVGSFYLLKEHEPMYFILAGGMGLAVDLGADAADAPPLDAPPPDPFAPQPARCDLNETCPR